MIEWPFDLQHHLRVARPDEVPQRLVVTPLRSDRQEIAGLLSFFGSEKEELWVLGVEFDCMSAHVVASLLALLTVARDMRILVPVLHPRARRQPHAVVLKDSTILGTRWERLPESVQAEVKRVAAALLVEHPDYVRAVINALSGHREADFEPLPRRFPFSDPKGECSLAPLPPSLPVDRQALAEFDDDETICRYVAADYRQEPYSRHVLNSDLEQRIADIFVNLAELEKPGTLAVQLDDPRCIRWLARITEAIEELRWRQGDSSIEWGEELIRSLQFPEPDDDFIARAAAAIVRSGVPARQGADPLR